MQRQPAVSVGDKYGRLTVIAEKGTNKHQKRIYLCKCDCGNEIITAGSSLKKGDTNSCGCYQKQRASECSKTHGLRKHPLYNVWSGMKGRCECKTNHKYHIYGSRGITVCPEWHSFENFYDWAIKNGYMEGLTLDRIDVNGNYEPSNCRWATSKVQSNNKRDTIHITAYGQTKTISEWIEITGLRYSAIYARVHRHGYTDERAIAPIGTYASRKGCKHRKKLVEVENENHNQEH